MSNSVFPELPGLEISMERETGYRTRIYESPDGTSEQCVSWSATPRYRYHLSYAVLRDDTAAPSPWNPYSELGALLWFLDQHKGAWDSFYFVDPLARRNYLTYSQDLSQAAWTKGHLSVTGGQSAPDGTSTAAKLVEDTAAGVEHLVDQNVNIADGTVAVSSILGKAGERAWLLVAHVQRDASTVLGAWFNLSTGAIGTVSGGVTPAVTALSGGWYRCSASGSVGSGATAPRARFKVAQSDNQATYTGDGTSGLYVWGAQTEPIPAASLYVPTGATAASGQIRVRFVEDSLSVRRIALQMYEASFDLVTVPS